MAFAMECFENGLLTLEDTEGLELRFGNAPAMLKMLEMIARRRGLGDVLAEGSRIAARRIGLDADRYSLQVKGVEFGMHEPRLKRGLGLGYAVAAVGADHGTGFHDTMAEQRVGEGLKTLGILEPMRADDLSYRKVGVFARVHQLAIARDCLVMCTFLPWNAQQLVDMTVAVTGWKTSLWELMLLGERVITMNRALNVREGLTADDDRLPERFFTGTTEGALSNKPMNREEVERAKHAYYRLMGWDPETGVPTPEKLGELAIEWVEEALPSR
jgi:aldehyde:ferredoxin oxidoreductase